MNWSAIPSPITPTVFTVLTYVLFPALAGPFFWKVLAGNWLAETARNVYTAATIFCGHAGSDVKSWPPGTRAHGRGEWYAMQVEASSDFEVSLPVSILCGGRDKQIEHHLFPTFPPPRLREIAPEVREICERHGVRQKTDTWGRTLRNTSARLGSHQKRAESHVGMMEARPPRTGRRRDNWLKSSPCTVAPASFDLARKMRAWGAPMPAQSLILLFAVGACVLTAFAMLGPTLFPVVQRIAVIPPRLPGNGPMGGPEM